MNTTGNLFTWSSYRFVYFPAVKEQIDTDVFYPPAYCGIGVTVLRWSAHPWAVNPLEAWLSTSALNLRLLVCVMCLDLCIDRWVVMFCLSTALLRPPIQWLMVYYLTNHPKVWKRGVARQTTAARQSMPRGFSSNPCGSEQCFHRAQVCGT